MSILTYFGFVSRIEKPLVWLHGQIKSPPLSRSARLEAGYLLRLLQQGEKMGLPHVRPMPSIAKRCFELRVMDRTLAWRVIYRLDADAIPILEVFKKQSRATPRQVIENCRKRLRIYDDETG